MPKRLAILIASTSILLAAVASTARARSTWAPLSPRLEDALTRGFPRDGLAVRVRLREADLPERGAARGAPLRLRQTRVLASLAKAGHRVVRRHQVLAGVALRVDPLALEMLRADPDVVSIHLDGRVYASLQQGLPQVGADDAHSLGLTGLGLNVAVLDTGMDTDHPHLADDLVAEQCFCAPSCCAGGASQAASAEDDDPDGHGTAVSGIITAPFSAANTGVAPDAGIVAVKVLDSDGSGMDSDVDAGLDWVLENRLLHDIRIVNLSLGDNTQRSNPSSYACAHSPTANAIDALYAAGVVVFAASGNNGYDAGINAPACNANAISVGGVYDAALGTRTWCLDSMCSTTCSDTDTAQDDFVCHSNSGSLLDILAPNDKTRTTKVGGGTTNFAGTSASSPYAAGQAALLLEADPTLTPEAIRALLKSHGPMVTNDDNGQSYRRSDVEAALLSLFECGDGVLDPNEDCDDGGTDPGDCCSPTCTFESAGSVCDDTDACTDSDECDGAGTCAGSAIVCDDANVCTDDSCDPGSGCVFTDNSAPCDDGDACTTPDTCAAGACSAGPPLACNDANACTDDGCDPGSGCVFANNTLPCDDGDACTTADACAGGACVGGPPPACVDGNACTDDGCDPGSGCVFTNNTVPCDDGDACTTADACAGGACAAGPPLDCDDGDACTADSCDGLSGCFHDPIAACGPVPASPGWARALVGAMLLAAAALSALHRRRG